jgi:hypothetical protein
VGEALLQGAQASREVLERDTQELVAVLRGARLAALPLFARDAQRSVITRIGRGGPAAPDGFNPDLEVRCCVVPLSLLSPSFPLAAGSGDAARGAV